ncbi:MAG: AraC family transcriptional regulator [Clostridiales bacterium]|nr:AraC family transcriptional regulator [Clostridiales bacterium]
MNIQQVLPLIQGKLLTQENNSDRSITSAYVCDLLSWVMAKGRQNMAWITVQTHLNVIAIAALHEMSCVILPEDIQMEDSSLNKAREEGIVVISSPLSAYALCGILAQQGIPA